MKKNQDYEHFQHTCYPIYDENSRILILGTFPSPKSREKKFFYSHPQNRFWKLLAALWKEEVPETIDEKKAFLLRNHIALWDVIESCDIIGASDSSIRNVKPAEIGQILQCADIKAIFANGAKAEQLYMKYQYESTGREIIKLPSTSPANAMYSLERLVNEWNKVLNI